MWTPRLAPVSVAALVLITGHAGADDGPPAPSVGRELTELSLEELTNLHVTSVSRRAERLADAPASVFVIERGIHLGARWSH